LLKQLGLFLGILFILILTSPQGLGAGEIYQGTVSAVSDGDTITLLTKDYERIKVRFYGVDAPEKKQPGGAEAKAALVQLIDQRQVEVEEIDTDRYSRLVGLVRFKGELINLTLVQEGHAWLYPQYCKIKGVCADIAKAEKTAKNRGLGLWAKDNPIAPWRWRKGDR
jgi:endonuclease YncB( thermonuclease family)